MSASILAEGLTLDVPLYLQRERRGSGWKQLLLGAAFDPPRRRFARLLEDVSFEVAEGDRLAILGRNGAGKSTLLRVLNRVYQPTHGRLQVAGSCQALLNMSLGFNQEATVRENIHLRGVAMGLDSRFLSTQTGPILDFANLREKANHRLRTLSSGQRLRLGFAISTSVQHDIILMDEWVGAGDSEFMARAKERMQDRVGGSKIVVLASHSISLLSSICNRGIVLEQGRLVHVGDIGSSLKAYHQLMAGLRAGREETAEARGARAYGLVSKVTSEGAGMYVAEGWCIDEEGAVPGGFAVRVLGQPCRMDRVAQTRRPDVMRKFGLVHDRCGFQLVFRLPEGIDVVRLQDIQVLVGPQPGEEIVALPFSGGNPQAENRT